MNTKARLEMPTHTITTENSITAYAYNGAECLIRLRSGEAVKGIPLTITLDLEEAKKHEGYRVAYGDELNWWTCVSEEVPKDKYIICKDGVYAWKVEGIWDGESYVITYMGHRRINFH